MKQYLLTIYQPDGPVPAPDAMRKIMSDVDAFLKDLKNADAWVFNGALHPPSSATVVRVRADEALVTDGPYVEGNEHVRGFCIVKAPDLDAALVWATRFARAVSPLAIEERPFHYTSAG